MPGEVGIPGPFGPRVSTTVVKFSLHLCLIAPA